MNEQMNGSAYELKGGKDGWIVVLVGWLDWARWHAPVMPALGKVRQEEAHKFSANLD